LEGFLISASGKWKQIYPRDCYRVLLVISGETGISFPKVVNIIVREGLIRLGKIPEDTSKASLLVQRPYVEPKKMSPEVVKWEKHFKEVQKQWPTLNEDAKRKQMKKARQLAEQFRSAKDFLTWLESHPNG